MGTCFPIPNQAWEQNTVGRIIIRRLLALIPVLLGISLVVFFVIRLIPGDAAVAILRQETRPELVEEIRRSLGIDQPMHVQLADWLWRVVRLDFGKSFVSGRPISDLILARLPITLELALAATIVSITIALPLGILTAVNRGGLWDYFERFFSLAGLSIPSFWLALIFILFFSLRLGILPAVGYVPFEENPLENLRRLILPALCLGIGMGAVVTRYMRSSLLEVLDQDYIRTARSKGLPNKAVIIRHALKNALIPVITVIGIQIGTLFGGTVIIESIFVWPGLGQLTLDAIYDRDYPVVQTTVMVMAFSFVIINLIVDLLYTFLDPRIRYE